MQQLISKIYKKFKFLQHISIQIYTLTTSIIFLDKLFNKDVDYSIKVFLMKFLKDLNFLFFFLTNFLKFIIQLYKMT